LLAVALALVALLLLGACSAGESSSDGDAAEPAVGGAPEAASDGDDSVAREEGDQGADEGSSGGVVDPGSTGRQVVQASIDVAVEDVEVAAEQVRLLADRVGGSLARESSSSTGERPRAELTVRVPVAETTQVMADVAALGEEVSRTTDSEVVETRLVDLESRTATQRAGVERIRALLEQAESLEDVLALEAELTRRQSDLESVDAQRAALADMAAMSTLTVVLTLPDDVEASEEPLPPFLDGLSAGWEALVASTTVVLVVVGALLPFAVVAAVLGGLVLLAVRLAGRRRRGADLGA
jgi:hypothetical protein